MATMIATNDCLSMSPISFTMVFCDILFSQPNKVLIFWSQNTKHFDPHCLCAMGDPLNPGLFLLNAFHLFKLNPNGTRLLDGT